MLANQLKTALFLGALSGLLLLLGHVLGGQHGMAVALVIALCMNFVTYFFSDKIVLAMYGAKPLDKAEFGFVYDIVEELAAEFHMPMPKLWLVPSTIANAFATGRNPSHASVAVTRGILDILDQTELRGVLAHELSHVINRDILVGTVAATIATAISYMADMIQWSLFWGYGRRDDREQGFGNVMVAIVMAIVVPIAAMLLQMAISRSREYLADETGARCCRDPLALASALEKLHGDVHRHPVAPTSHAQAATASLFIVYPFSGRGLINLFSTHPPMEKRIARLREMARRM